MATRGDRLHLGVSLLLGVESNVPILFIAGYLGYLWGAVFLGYLFVALCHCYSFIAVCGKKHLRVA